MSLNFDPGGYYAALDTSQWLKLKEALDGNEDQRQAAQDVLGSLVLSDWLEPEPELDMATRRPEQISTMREAREAYEDRCVEKRSRFGIDVLQRQLDADHPYDYLHLEATGRTLLRVAVELLDLARQRELDAEVDT
ncbi:hypothetical protein [Prauserella endophytica]|uniref:Uncharacterized protein n=1 Tax=Prauserella endophytica TaxID=1592324 RepID=A0ABY2S116_9PSEU|nr:hypothetical protein [Prauserella endophytica]TKG68345.1 hypothetical protein FCN18_21535 [Prauserella endophytica]